MSLAFHPVIFLGALLALLAGSLLELAWDGGLAGSGGGMLPLGLLAGGLCLMIGDLVMFTCCLGLLIGDFGLLAGGLEMWTGGLGV